MNSNYILSKIDTDEMKTHLVAIADYFAGEIVVELIKDGKQSYYWVGNAEGRIGFHISKERGKWSTRRSGYGDTNDWIEMYFLNELSLRLGNKIAFDAIEDKIVGVPHKYDYYITGDKNTSMRAAAYEFFGEDMRTAFEATFPQKMHHLFIEKP